MTKNSFAAEVTFNYTSKAIFVLEIFVLYFFLPLSVFQFRKVDGNKTLTFMMSLTQPAIACSKLTIETLELEQGVKYFQS